MTRVKYSARSSRPWERIKRTILKREPLCRRCREKNIFRAANTVDHIKPVAFGGDNSYNNLRPLCDKCHKEVTYEQFDGRLRPKYGLDGWPI